MNVVEADAGPQCWSEFWVVAFPVAVVVPDPLVLRWVVANVGCVFFLYVRVATGVDIVECVVDGDCDGIPNVWFCWL